MDRIGLREEALQEAMHHLGLLKAVAELPRWIMVAAVHLPGCQTLVLGLQLG